MGLYEFKLQARGHTRRGPATLRLGLLIFRFCRHCSRPALFLSVRINGPGDHLAGNLFGVQEYDPFALSLPLAPKLLPADNVIHLLFSDFSRSWTAALCKEQTFDPVDMLGSLDDQHLALTANAASIFLFDAGWPDHRTHAWLAALVGKQRTNQRFAIGLVGLCPAASARSRNRRRVDDIALDPFALQHAVVPEPVQGQPPE